MQTLTASLGMQIKWRRIILDEAHNCKDRSSNTARSAFALQARYRWALSGTPLQNRVTELYSLVRFLRIYPYSHYFADKTQCCSLDFPFSQDVRKCDLCHGSRMSHYCWWNRRVANPIKVRSYCLSPQLISLDRPKADRMPIHTLEVACYP
jgi:DNA repair protein RAD16